MDRRNFIKLTAITGTSVTLASCGNPENQLIRFVPDDDITPGIAEWKPSVCPVCRAGCGVTVRVMDADVDTVRNGQAGVVAMAVAKKLEGQPKHPISQGGLCAARPGVDPDHLSPRPSDAADEADRRARHRRVSADYVGRSDRRAGRQARRVGRGRRSEIARVDGASARESPDRAGVGSSCPVSAHRRQSSTNSSTTTCCPHGQRDQFRPRAAADHRHRAVAHRHRRSARTSSAPGIRRSRRARPMAGCARGSRRCAASWCRSNRACR